MDIIVYKSEIELLEQEVKEARVSGLKDIFFRFKELAGISTLSVDAADHLVKHAQFTMTSSNSNSVSISDLYLNRHE